MTIKWYCMTLNRGSIRFEIEGRLYNWYHDIDNSDTTTPIVITFWRDTVDINVLFPYNASQHTLNPVQYRVMKFINENPEIIFDPLWDGIIP